MNNRRIILPLDHTPTKEAIDIIKETSGIVWGYKLRRTILEEGVGIISKLKEYGNIMVDFKLYDIPSAMDEAIRLFTTMGADIITVHCTADYKPTLYAEKIAGVTILTSMKPAQFSRYYRSSINDTVHSMATKASEHGYGYVVCSPKEVNTLSHIQTKKICPGIRPLWYQEEDDQERTMTPADAVKAGADLLVIGRPLLNSSVIYEAIERTNNEMEQ